MKVHEFFSPHFTMQELTRSQRFPFVANIPTEEVVGNLQALCDNVLEPLRRVWKAPIYVNSAYRCRRLNKLVGGNSYNEFIAHALGILQKVEVANVEEVEYASGVTYFRLFHFYSTPLSESNVPYFNQIKNIYCSVLVNVRRCGVNTLERSG